MTRTEAEKLRKATILLRHAQDREADALVLMLDMVEQAVRDFDAEDAATDEAMKMFRP